MHRICLLSIVFGALLMVTGQIEAQTPLGTAFTYQGQLKDGGVPANGVYDIRFVLFGVATGPGALDVTCVNDVNVGGGLFTVPVDFGALFDGNERWLQVEVRLDPGSECGNGGGYTILGPRQALTAAPYALYALNGPGGGGPWTVDGTNIHNTNAGNVGIGTTAPASKLHALGNMASLRLQDDDNPASFFQVEDVHPTQARLNKVTSAGVSAIDFNPMPLDNTSFAMVRFFRETNSPGPKVVNFHRGNNTSNVSAQVGVDGANSFFQAHGGNVGIGTSTPLRALHIAADAAALRLQDDDNPASYSLLEDWQPAIMRLMKFTGVPGASLIDIDPMPSDGLGAAVVRLFRETNTTGVKAMEFYRGNNTNEAHAAIAVDGANSYFQLGGGNFGIGTPAPATKLHLVGNANVLRLEGADHSYVEWYPDGADAGRKAWMGFGGPSSNNFEIRNQIDGAHIVLNTTGVGNVGIGTSTPTAMLDVNGTGRVKVLEIVGADIAEKFPTSDDVEPGMVVAIDPANTGKVCLARGAYNRRVAGIVSGANDFSVGAVLGNLPGHEDAPAIALSGRVYVWCDATGGAIEPGDLLTTSDTPGHAMKATDRERSHGAVIGKAMSRLQSGRGMVLVLVNLQ